MFSSRTFSPNQTALALRIWNICLVSDVCIRLWAVIGARRGPYCPARCELICNCCFVLLGEINDDDDDESRTRAFDWYPHR